MSEGLGMSGSHTPNSILWSWGTDWEWTFRSSPTSSSFPHISPSGIRPPIGAPHILVTFSSVPRCSVSAIPRAAVFLFFPSKEGGTTLARRDRSRRAVELKFKLVSPALLRLACDVAIRAFGAVSTDAWLKVVFLPLGCAKMLVHWATLKALHIGAMDSQCLCEGGQRVWRCRRHLQILPTVFVPTRFPRLPLLPTLEVSAGLLARAPGAARSSAGSGAGASTRSPTRESLLRFSRWHRIGAGANSVGRVSAQRCSTLLVVLRKERTHDL